MKRELLDIFKLYGPGEFRTHDLLKISSRFQDECIQPLCHGSLLKKVNLNIKKIKQIKTKKNDNETK